MISARLLGSLALCLLAIPAWAAPKPLGTDDIRSLLTGNTVHGSWAGKEYFSYFEANGWTTYVEPGKPSSQGRWQAHADKYCSKWGEMGSETCYALEMDGDTLLWITSEGARYPSKILLGDQLPK
ncbi:MAG TPA: hypothetical protein VGJ75_06095 [Dongiaceae bacterium]|jgi:hypothetical protein